MEPKNQSKTKKNLAALAGVAVVALALTGLLLKSRAAQAAADKEDLKLQRVALGQPDPDQMRARMLDDLARDLALTEAQKTQMKSAMENGPDFGKIFGDKSLTQQQKFEKMRKEGEAQQAKIRSILTAEQQTKYDERQARMRAQFQQMRGAGQGRPGGFPGGMPGGPPR